VATLAQLPIGTAVSFETYAPTILGGSFVDAVVLAHLDADSTRMMGYDPYSVHANVFPSLPHGTPNNANQYSFVKLRLVSGQVTYLGAPWINGATIVIRNRQRCEIIVEDIGQSDVEKIVLALSANGYKAASVRLVDEVGA
jgi:hypothetical protein